MYVVGGERAKNRGFLGRRERFFVDYMLFLLSDSSPRLFQARPIGLNCLKNFFVGDDVQSHVAIRRALIAELDGYRYMDMLGLQTPSAQVRGLKKNSIHNDWSSWVVDTEPEEFLSALTREIVECLDGEHDLRYMAFLIRRLASELIDEFQSRRSAFGLFDKMLATEGGVSFFRENILQISAISQSKLYEIEIQLAPASVRGNLRQKVALRLPKFGLTNWRDIKLPNHRYDDDEFAVTTWAVQLRARNREEATAKAKQVFEDELMRLRSELYVNTSSIRDIKTTDLEFEGENPEDAVVWIPRATPFWRRHDEMPELPEYLPDLHTNDDAGLALSSKKLYAHAIANWVDDIHASASYVWQAIETTCSDNITKEKYQPVSFSFLTESVLRKSRVLFVKQSNKYYSNLRRIGIDTNEEINVSRVGQKKADEWFEKVFSESGKVDNSLFHPYPPDILFHRKVGLLQETISRDHKISANHWMNKRITMDLNYLYGVRCALVHSGRNLGTTGFVEYLAGMGLNFLLDVSRSKQVVTSVSSGL